jgi:uncharacterized membrane protein
VNKLPEIREFVTGFVGIIIGLVVAVSLIPVISTSIAQANLSGTTAIMVGLIPLLVSVGLLLFAVKSLF